jgi:lipopolysaccharide/colanic/teichoic acid biosynthesis glycosyltransferase
MSNSAFAHARLDRLGRLGLYERTFKRPLDLILSTAALILLSPVMAVIAVLIAFRMGRPVLFTQERPGRDGVPFRILKFRTMTDQRDEHGELLPDEIRLTRLGATLRSTSLDELPELINVLRGEMSLVGPRPWLMQYLSRYTPEQARRMSVRPGLTGLAQATSRNTASWSERLDLDLAYVDSITALTDAKIIVKTVAMVLTRSGISHEGHATMPEFQKDSR